jgi:glucose-1-phosphate cytidylyltransferase
VKAVILAGGLGTRLREETEFRPKPMVEIGGQPILWHIMKIFSHYDVNDFVVCIGYRGDVIKDYFANYETRSNDFTVRLGATKEIEFLDAHLESDWRVTVIDTGQETMTGGRVKQAEPFVAGQRCMVTYGDSLADIDIAALLAFHEQHGRLATMTTVQPLTRFGIVEIEDDGTVRRFREKPQSDECVNGGFFVFEPRVLENYLDKDSVLEREPLERLAKEGQLVAYRHEGFWQPMDTYREFTILNDLWHAGSAPWKVWNK